jgi:L-fuculose-phosphate aldolase
MFEQGKQRHHARVQYDIQALLPEREARPTRQALALGARILARHGHFGVSLAGQITARAEDEDGHFLTLGFAVGFDEARASRVATVDDDLNPVRGSRTMPNPATRFHLWVYRGRPDVRAVVHTHPPAASALSMLGEDLVVAHMDQTPFADDLAYLRDWPGLPIGDDEGRLIADALGTKRSLLLANHGLLTTGRSVEEAVVLAVWLEHAAELHLRARAVGRPEPVKAELARESHDFLVTPEVTGLTFDWFARRVVLSDPLVLD